MKEVAQQEALQAIIAMDPFTAIGVESARVSFQI
jgi:hypothetical protein